MADVDDKEKAEKLAAAKKRFEQLKKQQKGKKGGKKKTDKSEAAETKDDDTNEQSKEDEEAAVEPSAQAETDADADADGEQPAAETDETDETSERPAAERKPSESQQSRQRSASFRQNSGIASPTAAKSPGLPSISAEEEVQDIYRKQASRIEELEKENKAFNDQQAKLDRAEDELEQLRETSRDVAELRSKAALADKRQEEIERLEAEVTSVQRQLTHAQQQQQQATDKRRKSNASPTRELTTQLQAKTSTIESLELELSNLRNQYNMSTSALSTHEATIKDLEARATTAESSLAAATQELSSLKESLANPAPEGSSSEDDDVAAFKQKTTLLESDLRTTKQELEAAVSRATSLDSKVETLTKILKDNTTSHEKDMKDMTTRLAKLSTSSAPAIPTDPDALSDDVQDLEHEALHKKIRELEADNFELRRGVWRDQRAALQPDIHDNSPPYEDVDLTNPYAARPPHARTSSSFQDVIQSGISAFTGRDRRQSVVGLGHERQQSLGLLDEEGFDEDAFARAQEEEAKRRIERIREVKRGLEGWRGWRADFVDVRAAGLGGVPTGPLFEV